MAGRGGGGVEMITINAESAMNNIRFATGQQILKRTDIPRDNWTI